MSNYDVKQEVTDKYSLRGRVFHKMREDILNGHYKEHEEWPELGFSPDANFPGIFAEKGILSIELKNYFKIKDFEKGKRKNIKARKIL